MSLRVSRNNALRSLSGMEYSGQGGTAVRSQHGALMIVPTEGFLSQAVSATFHPPNRDLLPNGPLLHLGTHDSRARFGHILRLRGGRRTMRQASSRAAHSLSLRSNHRRQRYFQSFADLEYP